MIVETPLRRHLGGRAVQGNKMMKTIALTMAAIAAVATVGFAAPASAGRGHGFDEAILKWSEERDRHHAAGRTRVRFKSWSHSRATRLRAQRARAATIKRARRNAVAAAAARQRAARMARAAAITKAKASGRLQAVEAELRQLRAENRRLMRERNQAAPAAPREDQSISDTQGIINAGRNGRCKRFVPGAGITISVPCAAM